MCIPRDTKPYKNSCQNVTSKKHNYLKRKLLTLAMLGFSLIAKSQTASVEKTIFGVQTGAAGLWLHNESKLSNQIVVRSEIGIESNQGIGDLHEKVFHFFIPVIIIEPKWYYNLHKRVSKSKTIEGNSGNFISLKTSHHPDWFVISKNENLRIIKDITIVPNWGIRRNIGQRFNYETGIGLGYRYIFAKDAGYFKNGSEIEGYLHLRIGYKF